MIYLDSSVALARALREKRRPPPQFWDQPITSSALLEYELWTRLNAYALPTREEAEARSVVEHVVLVEMSPAVLSRALQPYPVPVRTLDGLHLATMDYLRGQGREIELASYDARLLAAAEAMGIEAVAP